MLPPYCVVCALGELKAGEMSVWLLSRDGFFSSIAYLSVLGSREIMDTFWASLDRDV